MEKRFGKRREREREGGAWIELINDDLNNAWVYSYHKYLFVCECKFVKRILLESFTV